MWIVTLRIYLVILHLQIVRCSWNSIHEILTRMHSSRMRTAPSSSHRGGGLDLIPLNFPLGCGPGPDPPQFPPWVWAWTWSPSISPSSLGCGPGPDPPQFPPRVWAWRPPLGPDQTPPGAGTPQHPRTSLVAGTPPLPQEQVPPPVDRILGTRFWKYYLAPNFVCER